MSILIDDGSRVLVQGITGREGQFHTERMIRYGTRVVGGVTPGRGGQPTLGVPVFDSVRQAVRETGADVSVAFVPAALAADAACEASEAGIRLVVVIAEHVPVLDMVRVKAFFRERGTLLVGPNCPGIISPGKCKVGIMPGYIHRPGGVGLVSRSGTLTFHAVNGGSNPPGDAKNFNRLQQLSFWVTKIGLQFFLRRPSLEEFLF